MFSKTRYSTGCTPPPFFFSPPSTPPPLISIMKEQPASGTSDTTIATIVGIPNVASSTKQAPSPTGSSRSSDVKLFGGTDSSKTATPRPGTLGGIDNSGSSIFEAPTPATAFNFGPSSSLFAPPKQLSNGAPADKSGSVFFTKPGGDKKTPASAFPASTAFNLSGSVFGPASQPPFSFSQSMPAPSSTYAHPSGEMVHTGISCGFCGKTNIRGVRYTCLQCLSYDRCSACMAAPKAWASHHSSHQFFPITTPGDFGDCNVVKQAGSYWKSEAKVTHPGVRCDGCAKSIEGARHKCLQCEDFDFCDACIADPQKRAQHPPAHPFFPIASASDRTTYDRARTLFRTNTPTMDQVQLRLPRPSGFVRDLCTEQRS